MAAQENTEITTKFSKLNVNAVEFVPSFNYSSAASAAAVAAAAAAVVVNAPPPSSQQQSTPVDNAAVATATEAGTGSVPVSGSATPATTPDSTGSVGSTNALNAAASAGVAAAAPSSGAASNSASPAQGSPVTTPSTATAAALPPIENINAADKVTANNETDPADSWDVEEDAIITPEDEEAEDTEFTEGEATPKVSKKKVVKVEENRSKREHVNVVFIGHVDAGKSTIGGQIMSLTGMVDKRTLEKYEREAREKSRESWYLSWALDTNQEERDKGKTVEVGRAFFETDRKHFTILDAPGHKSFVPNMIGGAAQADLAVLVISARKGEFETGFDRGGQTREHAMLAKTAGVKHLVVLVNKMDDPTVNWDQGRYNECKDKILPYLKKLGFNPAKDLTFMPCSGLSGYGLKDQVPETLCTWYRGPAFIPFIDELPSLNRKTDGPFIMPIVDKYKDMGTVVMGKVESGMARKGQNLLVMPNRTQVAVDQLFSDDYEVTSVGPGENVKIKLKGIEEEDVSPGFVLCDATNPIKTGKVFDAQVVILEHKSIICAGYSAVMHIHCAAEEVTVKALICLVDKKTGEKSKTRPRFVKQDQVAIMRIECYGMICLEQFKLFPQMGRFTLRDENKTIAIGKVLKVIE
ncbi:eukaryotic peptide chain release factor GTP-binding subunit ERF3A isoform X1 [Drosophila nasuta]|uniref:eukaryotic peptide chain release factor GTP-binding subunit ERF3A isoform X1 n=1 Tax=Drosophila nasuta TaxID=42062 RepID=UPI00295E7634|nr:eukaryotic peptide chain release factor GTP-binding subunit ERF3A isoform X1 [Drosophila nasuta]XP_060666851.1 eukaryotic peptide chain release factor GTP-binding subunit ERF3A isoform X1 [Drosophila nasuta]XP_060666852.1 eukaryotic peptide chain release factor GTP-binding subunit ERF3A isoform X1 [Drosophila nasuta]